MLRQGEHGSSLGGSSDRYQIRTDDGEKKFGGERALERTHGDGEDYPSESEIPTSLETGWSPSTGKTLRARLVSYACPLSEIFSLLVLGFLRCLKRRTAS